MKSSSVFLFKKLIYLYNMKYRLYILTFIGVASIILIAGYIGMDLSLKYMQQKYIEIQLDVNKRQAENIAKILENQLQTGSSKETVLNNLQSIVTGTDTEKGFLCMFDKSDAALVCHPDKKMVGMKLPEQMQFENNQNGIFSKTVDIIASGKGTGGLFHTKNKTEVTYMIPVKGTDWMLSVHENIAMIKAEILRQRNLFFIGFLIISLITAIIATFMARLIGRQYEKTIEKQNKELESVNLELQVLNSELNQQKEEITAQRDEIEKQKTFVEKQKDNIEARNRDINASIQYASRIQEALLPPKEIISDLLVKHFIFYKPRDIVSGDFYWFKKIEDTFVFAVADCTGHGVPGAFMSMLGIAFLNEIVSDDTHNPATCSANLILNDLRNKVVTSLRQSIDNDTTRDGMDIALVMINTKTYELQFAGAYNPLYILRNKELAEVKGDRMPVGIHSKKDGSFKNNPGKLKKGDRLYMFSDGFADQSGGIKGRKYLKKRFREFITENSDKPMKIQKEIIESEFNKWKGEREQIDDVLVVGFELN